jgi:hypothetical protein
MNPARSLGPGLVSGELHELWIYVVAPLAGAALGAFAYQLVRGDHPPSRFEPLSEPKLDGAPEEGT